MRLSKLIFLRHSVAVVVFLFSLSACVPSESGFLNSGFEEGDSSAVSAIKDSALVVPDPDQTVEQEISDLEHLGEWEEGVPANEPFEVKVVYDFPITINRQVEYYLDFFQNKNRAVFARWLARSGRYRPLIQDYFKEAGLPSDLVYLAMIESGFNERAYSRARAVGLWQFIKGTGRNYNLTVDDYVDERRDPIKSTKAAAAYLSDLYKEFGSWYLAVAGYNAGEGRIRGAIRRSKSNDFWKLAQGRYLRLETKRYVPKLIAAIMIAKNPGKYGFGDIQYESPFTYETVEVPQWTALKAVSLASGVDVETLRNYNRELRKGFTPPNKSAYPLRVPDGKASLTVRNLPRVHVSISTDYKIHKVKNGETLALICRRYGLAEHIVKKANKLRAAQVVAGQRLLIPFRTTSYKLLPEGSKVSGYLATDLSRGEFILHKILPGETMSEISARYNIPTHIIAVWNDLRDISRIKAGQQLVLYVKEQGDSGAANQEGGDLAAYENDALEKSTALGKTSVDVDEGETPASSGLIRYRVQKGDSLWLIARRYHVASGDIKQWNNLSEDVIFPGKILVLRVPEESGDRETYYRVRSGDSLWTIARRHNLSTDSIKMWNNLESDIIRPGNQLLLKLAEGV